MELPLFSKSIDNFTKNYLIVNAENYRVTNAVISFSGLLVHPALAILKSAEAALYVALSIITKTAQFFIPKDRSAWVNAKVLEPLSNRAVLSMSSTMMAAFRTLSNFGGEEFVKKLDNKVTTSFENAANSKFMQGIKHCHWNGFTAPKVEPKKKPSSSASDPLSKPKTHSHWNQYTAVGATVLGVVFVAGLAYYVASNLATPLPPPPPSSSSYSSQSQSASYSASPSPSPTSSSSSASSSQSQSASYSATPSPSPTFSSSSVSSSQSQSASYSATPSPSPTFSSSSVLPSTPALNYSLTDYIVGAGTVLVVGTALYGLSAMASRTLGPRIKAKIVKKFITSYFHSTN